VSHSDRHAKSGWRTAVIVTALSLGVAALAPFAAASQTRLRASAHHLINDLSQVAMRNSQQGYGLFVTSDGTPCKTYVARTSDGASTFHALAHAPGCGGMLATDSEGDAFLGDSDALFVSHDSDAAWFRIPEPGRVAQVVAVGATVWAAFASCRSKLATDFPLELSVSMNGGRPWRLDAAQPNGARGWSDGGGGTYLVLASNTVGLRRLASREGGHVADLGHRGGPRTVPGLPERSRRDVGHDRLRDRQSCHHAGHSQRR